MRLTKPFILQLIFLLSSFQAIYAFDWELAKNKNGVIVHTREVENSALKEFRGKVIIQSTVEDALELIKAPSSYTAWLHDCKSAELLKSNSKEEWFVYLRNGAPWPVNDRDVIFKSNLTKDSKGEVIIRFNESTALSKPIPDGVVRIPKMKGLWKVTPLEDGKIQVIYQAHTDPGGSIPEFAANIAVVDIPYNTLFNLKKKLASKK
jgi:hypothetical protein